MRWPIETPHREVPRIGKGRECQRAGSDRNEQEAPRHIVDDNEQRIDARRRMKSPGRVHRDHGNPNRNCSRPRLRSRELDDDEPDQSRQ